LRISSFWPATTPTTRGAYMHSVCAITAGGVGAAARPARRRLDPHQHVAQLAVGDHHVVSRARSWRTPGRWRDRPAWPRARDRPFQVTAPVIDPVVGAAAAGRRDRGGQGGGDEERAAHRPR
jgi:hypothetical protein